MKRQRGVALVVVLWLSVLLGVLLSGFVLNVRNETNLARNRIEIAKAQAAAQAGVQLAAHHLLAAPPEARWKPDGSQHSASFGEAKLQIAVLSEAGKVDINEAPEALLAALFIELGEESDRARRLAAAVVDWRDKDDLLHLNGAEVEDYRAAGLPGPGNRPFHDVAELAGVLGMSPTLFRRAVDLVTVHSGQDWVYVPFAMPAVKTAFEQSGGAQLVGGRHRRPRSQNNYSVHVQASLPSGVRARNQVLLRLGQRRGSDEPYRVLTWQNRSSLFTATAPVTE